MTAPQHEESVIDATLLADLSDITARISPDSRDARLPLNDFRCLIERACGIAAQGQDPHLLDYTMILLEGLDQILDADRPLTLSEYRVLKQAPQILEDFLVPPLSTRTSHLLQKLLDNPNWASPGTIGSAQAHPLSANHRGDCPPPDAGVAIDDILAGISEGNDHDASPAPDTPPGPDPVETPELDCRPDSTMEAGISALDPTQQELVDLIKAELDEIVNSQYSPEYDLNSDDPESCALIINNLAEQAEKVSNALELIGLEGASLCSKLISDNINSYLSTTGELNKNHAFILKQWPVKLLAYLNRLGDKDSSGELLTLLSSESWPRPLDCQEYQRIQPLLENPVFHDEEQEQRQVSAKFEDVDLRLPDDVNQELLDGLLQDLPSQTEEFSTAIQNLAEGGGLENIDTAQRVAHTLKGAANVVGVRGIANLTHHLEDILEAQAKARALPDSVLTEVLVRASDCLESMTETLLGIDTEPDDAVEVLQDVLNWANRLDNPDAQAPAALDFGNGSERDQSNIEGPADSSQPKTDKIAPENLLRIPVTLADDMLRLAGENLIYTSQIQENIHNLVKKQDALDLHNHSLLQLSYDLEHLIDIQGYMPGSDHKNADAIFDPLEMDEYHEIHTISRRLVEIAADSVELSQELEKDLSDINELVVSQNQLHKEGEELVLRTRMVPIKTIIPRLKRGVRQASRLTGKQVELVVRDNNTFLDSDVLNGMIDPMMHILRNSIDHGIEGEEERIVNGKAVVGTIKLDFERKGNQIVIGIYDDGRGLDTDYIYSKALSSALIAADDELSTENIHKLILEPGFTTKSNVTQVSGRGIGLDVVSVKIRELKGSIDIHSEKGKGCRITLSLPISSFSTHSLLVRVRQYIYAISSHGIEEIIYPGMGELRDIGDQTVFQLGREAFSAVLLDSLLNLPPDRRKIERNDRPILLVKDESGTRTAILVQDVIDSRDVVVKGMGSYIPKLNGIIGATVLGDGSVSPVIDLPELLHDTTSSHRTADDKASDTAVKPARRAPYALVVDDSLSSRRSLAQFAEDLGLSVRTARDGLDALTIIEANTPDLLIVDMEMPKMNGLELTSHIRATPDLGKIPVIMITSRSTDKHRKAAMDKGVDRYMVKPFDEDELAQHINGLLEEGR